MKSPTLAVFAALMAASTLTLASESDAQAARDQRMNDALDRAHDIRNRDSGPAARTENSVKRGVTKTGHAITHTAHKVGHTISTGAHKTGEAIHNTGERIEDQVDRK
jgi:hypothetical protein